MLIGTFHIGETDVVNHHCILFLVVTGLLSNWYDFLITILLLLQPSSVYLINLYNTLSILHRSLCHSSLSFYQE